VISINTINTAIDKNAKTANNGLAIKATPQYNLQAVLFSKCSNSAKHATQTIWFFKTEFVQVSENAILVSGQLGD